VPFRRSTLSIILAALVLTSGTGSVHASTGQVTFGKGLVYNDRTRVWDTVTLLASTVRTKSTSKVEAQGSLWNVQCYYSTRIPGGYRIGIRAQAYPGGAYLYLLLDDHVDGTTDRALAYIPYPDKVDDPPFCGFEDGLFYIPLMKNVLNGSFRTKTL
jgi:hypothetical protein